MNINKIKSALLVACLMTISIMSCQKESFTLGDQSIAISELPDNAVAFIDNNYPDASIYSALKVNDGNADYIAVLSTNEEVAFSSDGTFLGDGEDKHSGTRSERGMRGKGKHKKHGLDSLRKKGHCDSLGKDSSYHKGRPHRRHFDTSLLSQSIKTYIANNYSGYSIRNAETISNCSGNEFTSVLIVKEDVGAMRLFFDASGNYIMKGERILYSEVSAAVSSYISATYADYKVRLKAIKLTKADGSIQYMVFINKDRTHKAILIDQNGTVICVK